jgi:tetratricopeptide (TPR) repeat protein
MKKTKETFLFGSALLLFLFLVHGFSASAALARNLSEDEQLIQVGVGAFQDRVYDIAARQFSIFVKDFPSHPKLSDVLYLLARSLLLQGKLKEANGVFSRIIHENRTIESMDYVLFWMAQTEMRQGYHEASRKWLLQLTKNYPKFEYIDYAYYHLGCLEAEGNRPDSAESHFERVLVLSKSPQLLRSSAFWLGLVSAKQGKYEKAIHYIEPLCENVKEPAFGNGRESLFWLAEAQWRRGRFQEALKSYQILYNQFRTDPLISQIYWRMGFCEYLLGNLKESADRLKSFQSLYKESPLLLYTHYLLGEIFLDLGDYVSSIQELNLILQAPQPHPLWPAGLLLLYWDHLQLNNKGDTLRAAQRLLKLQAAEDEKSFIQWLMAQNLFADGKVVDALPYYFGVLNSRFRERALLQIGKGYFLQSQFREALTNLELLVMEFPNLKPLGEALFLKGECLLGLGETGRAVETYDRILGYSNKDAWSLMALTQLAGHYLSLGQEAKAEEAFKQITDDPSPHPLFYHAAFQLGILSEKKKDLQTASRFFALVLKAGSAELLGPTYFRFGEVLIQQDRLDKAFASFNAALSYFSRDSAWFGITQLEIGNIQRRRGNYEEARRSYETAQTFARDEQIANAARESLKHLGAK